MNAGKFSRRKKLETKTKLQENANSWSVNSINKAFVEQFFVLIVNFFFCSGGTIHLIKNVINIREALVFFCILHWICFAREKNF